MSSDVGNLLQSTARGAGRSLSDRLLLLVVALCVAVAVVRLLLVMAAVPYAFYVDARSGGTTSSGEPITVAARIKASTPFATWWGARKIPFRAGGDYLKVMSHSSSKRTLGCVAGVVVRDQERYGLDIRTVITPIDEKALFGTVAGTPMTRADGTAYVAEWAPIGYGAAFFTDVPFVQARYRPLLTPAVAARLESQLPLRRIEKEIYVPAAGTVAGKTYAIVSRQRGEVRDFLIVPVELVGEDVGL